MITAAQLRAARTLLGLSQRHLARLAGLSLTTIQRMEASEGYVCGNLDALMKLVDALERAGEQLCRGLRRKHWQRYQGHPLSASQAVGLGGAQHEATSPHQASARAWRRKGAGAPGYGALRRHPDRNRHRVALFVIRPWRSPIIPAWDSS